MKWSDNKKKITTFSLALGLTLMGTYNSVVINSDSTISSDVRFAKRLDEVYGVITPGRMVAASMKWEKLKRDEKTNTLQVVQTVQTIDSAVTEVSEESKAPDVAAVQEDLQLNLSEVINPRKWQQGLPVGQFSGSLTTNNGMIESLDVALPNGEGVSVSYSEMVGNVFNYDFEGEIYTGMMYQVDQFSYMVTLTTGPLEGTRLRFSTGNQEAQQAENQEYLAETHQVEAGNFGNSASDEYGNSEAFSQQTEVLQDDATEYAVKL